MVNQILVFSSMREKDTAYNQLNQTTSDQKSVADKSIHILNAKGFKNEAKDPSLVFALVAKEQITQPQMVVPPAV